MNMGPSPLSLLAALLLRNDDAHDPACLELLRQWHDLAYPEREAQVLTHLQLYLNGVSRMCPYYGKSLSSALGEEFLTWERFRGLPRTSRSDLMDAEAGLYASKQGPAWKPVGSTSTSGSTGTPIVTKQTKGRLRLQGFLTQLWHERSARDPGRNVAFITEPLRKAAALQPGGMSRGVWAKSGRGQAYAYSLTAPPAVQLRGLVQRDISTLITYPSNLRSLLHESEASGVAPKRLSHVVLSSEPIPDELIDWTKRAWGAGVVATYSTSELAAIALSDDEGTYRNQDASVWVEVLDEDGSPTAAGQIGRIVVTTLQEMLRPLIRYDVGDYAEVGRTRDGELVLRRIVGRERAMIHTKEGSRVWPYFELGQLAERGVVRSWQMIQHRDRSLTMRVATTQPLATEDEELIRSSVGTMSGGLPLNIVQVSEIERTTRGKFREVISELDAATPS